MILSNTYFFEHDGNSYGYFFCAKEVLYDSYSKYQRITVFDTDEVGRVLMLNNIFNVSTVMEAFYHEPMAHIPIGMLNKPKDILIIGGGDFGLAGHVLKHSMIDNVIQCEIDEEVVKVSRKYFPEWAVVEKDPRFKLIIDDGFKYLNSTNRYFDLIIIDSTDAFEDVTASVLSSREFYELTKRALKENGLIIQIIADSFFYKKFWAQVLINVQTVFHKLAPFFVPIPFYSTGTWGLLLIGKGEVNLNPKNITQSYLNSIPDLATITRDSINGWFSLPPYIINFMRPLYKELCNE